MKKNIHHAQKFKNSIMNYIYLKGRKLSAKGITASCTLPLVIANVLQTPVVVLKNMPHIPMILFSPDNYFPSKNIFWVLYSKGKCVNLRFTKMSMQLKKQKHNRYHHQTTKISFAVAVIV